VYLEGEDAVTERETQANLQGIFFRFCTGTHFPRAVNVVKEDSEYLIVGVSQEDEKLHKKCELPHMNINISAIGSELGKEHAEEEEEGAMHSFQDNNKITQVLKS
jgi:hypothetical protein